MLVDMKKIENELFLKFSGIIFYTLLLLIEIPKYFCKKFFGIHRASLARNNLIIFFIFDMFFYYIDYYYFLLINNFLFQCFLLSFENSEETFYFMNFLD